MRSNFVGKLAVRRDSAVTFLTWWEPLVSEQISLFKDNIEQRESSCSSVFMFSHVVCSSISFLGYLLKQSFRGHMVALVSEI